ncbi:MAG: ArsA family ATPase [Candidatus Korarchaeota archaeon]
MESNSLPEKIENMEKLISERKFLLFGGKGGVGKTSISASTAFHSAKMGRKTLIISTDPAHCLSDIFRQKIGPKVVPVKEIANLYALELDPKVEIAEYEEALHAWMSVSEFPVGDELIDSEALTPGMDEAIALKKITELMNDQEYDNIIFDTAPTGHTLRLLGLPDVLSGMLGKLLKLRLYLSKMASMFKRLFGQDDEEDNTLEMLFKLKDSMEDVRQLLSDDTKTAFVIVMIPEAMGIAGTEKILQGLEEFDIPHPAIVVNMIAPENPSCTFCAKRHELHQKYLQKIRHIYDDFLLREVPLLPNEVYGIESLELVEKYLFP